MAGPAETISFVARRLIQFELRFAQSTPVRKRDAAALFSRIAQSVQVLIADLGRDQLPHEACRELVYFSTKLKECTEEELGATEADRLASALRDASDKEKIYLEFRSSDRKGYLTEELEKAAILIQALANGLYMAPTAEEDALAENPPGTALDA
jgi:hypothetical protein